MCKRCVYLENRPGLLDNIGNTFDQDVAGTTVVNVMAVIVDIEQDVVGILCYDHACVNVEGVQMDDSIPHFLYQFKLADESGQVSPLLIQEAINRGSVLPSQDLNTVGKVHDYLADLWEQDRYIVAMNHNDSDVSDEVPSGIWSTFKEDN